MMVNQVVTTPYVYDNSSTDSTDQLGKNDFLKLLLAQLQNQDPLEPLKNEEFVAQLAQFNSLEQLINLNETMQTVGVLQILTSSSSLLGKPVEAAQDDDTTVEGKVVEVGFLNGDVVLSLDVDGTTVDVSVKDILKVS